MIFTDEQMKTLYQTVDAEAHCLVNEWDSSTNRMPSAARMKEKEALLAIREKCLALQPALDAERKFINIDSIRGGELSLSDKERITLRKLLMREEKSLKRESANAPATYEKGSYYDLVAKTHAGISSLLKIL